MDACFKNINFMPFVMNGSARRLIFAAHTKQHKNFAKSKFFIVLRVE